MSCNPWSNGLVALITSLRKWGGFKSLQMQADRWYLGVKKVGKKIKMICPGHIILTFRH